MKFSCIILCLLFLSCATKKTAEFYFTQGKNEEVQTNSYVAIQKYTKAIKINPNYIDAYIERAKVNMSIDSVQNAITDYDSILIKIDNNNYEKKAVMYLAKGDALYLLSEDSLACKCYERAKFLGNNQSWDRIRNRCKNK